MCFINILQKLAESLFLLSFLFEVSSLDFFFYRFEIIPPNNTAETIVRKTTKADERKKWPNLHFFLGVNRSMAKDMRKIGAFSMKFRNQQK